ncbi:thiamine pyrophosphate-dependent enzyme [Magnetovibrio sp. PR-2]|uniref:thiamine pyrophosphate-dependent enzyme n=1 Tax=Magnetovibrio sp. PR-2 TaxID=3120356 RepID=UPI002FCE1999
MIRYQILEAIVNAMTDEIVVCNIGHPSQELYGLRDREENFYMLGSMGLASSIGLGIAMSKPNKKVVVIDGDGACSMNMGGLATIAHNAPSNLCVVIIDNHANGSTGFQPTFTAGELQLDKVAKGCGIQNVRRMDDATDIATTIQEELNTDGASVIVAKAEIGLMDNIQIIPMNGVQVKQRMTKVLSS